MRAGPADDRQAARLRVAAAFGARVPEEREADAALRDVVRQALRRDELTALAVGEDEHRAPVLGDELAGLRGRAGGEGA
jgi:hypothetical protein